MGRREEMRGMEREEEERDVRVTEKRKGETKDRIGR